MHVKLIAQQERSFRSGPSHQIGSLPSPFLEIGDGCSHGSTDCVAWVLLGLKLVIASLLQRSQLLRGPGMDEAVDGFDVVDDDLITWIDVLLLAQVVGTVK